MEGVKEGLTNMSQNVFGGEVSQGLQKAAGIAGATAIAMEELKNIINAPDFMGSFVAGLDGVANIMGNLKGIVGETAGAWLQWASTVLTSIAQAIPQIIALGNTQIASAAAQSTANTSVAATGAAASVASIPIVGWIMAGVAVASVIASLASIPKPQKFANGGIVYGNTFAQIGEYAGAANNPEVVAPLNKLRSLIEPSAEIGKGKVEFRISGRDLVGMLGKMNNINNRTR